MAAGKVRWFSSDKGFGLITPDDGRADVFVHYTDLRADGYPFLKQGQRVEFELRAGTNGPRAGSIKAL
jgi:cold shock protein